MIFVNRTIYTIISIMDSFTSQGFTKEHIKIKTYECYTKIQEARPAHRSNLINKELGYDTIIEPSEEIESTKIKNCVNSARSNSELFKRFSKKFITNIKNDIDQLFLFTSVNPLTRLETSIGMQTNPGIFLIIGLTYLDEKYKDSYQKCDIEFSFLEYRESQMFDLLCHTGEPLMVQKEGEDVNFKEHWVRASTFNQFIKIFKVALFNNKERDFKSDEDGKCKSTFIMKVRNKLYNQEGQLIRSQETTLVDFEVNCLKEISANLKEKQGSRSLFDYMLIDMNNANPEHKQVHYHMVEENYFLLLLRKFLTRKKSQHSPTGSTKEEREMLTVGGQVTIIHSMPADKQSFHSCHNYLTNIVAAIGEPWQARVASKPKPSKQFNRRYVEYQLRKIIQGVSMNTYSSLRNFNEYKQQLINQIKRCKLVMRQLKKSINSSARQKIQLTFMKNQLMAHEMKLIGNCIKSDHFKDFYNAKSYIQLQREVAIKTEGIKEEIKLKMKVLQEMERRFMGVKRREVDNYQKYTQERQTKKLTNVEHLFNNATNWPNYLSMQTTKQNWATKTRQSKFKKISMVKGEVNYLYELKKLINHLNQYMYSLWDSYIAFDERTIADSIEFEEIMGEEENLLNEAIGKFITEVEGISETEILYEQDNNIYNNNQVGLFRSLNFLGLIGPKKRVDNYEVGKRLVIKTNQKYKTKSKQNKSLAMTLSKLPSLCAKSLPVVISGKIKMSEMLINPKSDNLNKSACII